jgi:hypothetical protein
MKPHEIVPDVHLIGVFEWDRRLFDIVDPVQWQIQTIGCPLLNDRLPPSWRMVDLTYWQRRRFSGLPWMRRAQTRTCLPRSPLRPPVELHRATLCDTALRKGE